MIFPSQIWRKYNDNICFSGISISSFSSVDAMMISESDDKKSSVFACNQRFCFKYTKAHASLFSTEHLSRVRTQLAEAHDNFFNLKLVKKRIRKKMEKHGHDIKEQIYQDAVRCLVDIYVGELETKISDYNMQNSYGALNISKVWRYDHLNLLFIKMDGNFIGFIDYLKNRSMAHIISLCNFHDLPLWRIEDIIVNDFGDYFFTNIKFATQLAIADFCNTDK